MGGAARRVWRIAREIYLWRGNASPQDLAQRPPQRTEGHWQGHRPPPLREDVVWHVTSPMLSFPSSQSSSDHGKGLNETICYQATSDADEKNKFLSIFCIPVVVCKRFFRQLNWSTQIIFFLSFFFFSIF